MVLFFLFATLGGVLACLNGPSATCHRERKLLSFLPLAFSLCRLNSPVVLTPDAGCQLYPQSVAWQNGHICNDRLPHGEGRPVPPSSLGAASSPVWMLVPSAPLVASFLKLFQCKHRCDGFPWHESCNHRCTKPWVCRRGPAMRGLSAAAGPSWPSPARSPRAAGAVLAQLPAALGRVQERQMRRCQVAAGSCPPAFGLDVQSQGYHLLNYIQPLCKYLRGKRRLRAKCHHFTRKGRWYGCVLRLCLFGLLGATCGVQRLIIWKVNVMPWKGKKKFFFPCSPLFPSPAYTTWLPNQSFKKFLSILYYITVLSNPEMKFHDVNQHLHIWICCWGFFGDIQFLRTSSGDPVRAVVLKGADNSVSFCFSGSM